MIADELNECTVHQIVAQDLNTRKVCAKMVPENFNDYQKARRNEVSAEMLEWPKSGSDFLNRVITGDESWFLEYGPEAKRHEQGMAHATVSKAEESSHQQIKNQDKGHNFF
jgi:uncharacterized protein (DUF2237 family)